MRSLLNGPQSDAAFERLFKRHVKDVYRYSLAVLGEQADAEDVTQTTFLNAYRSYERGERPEKPRSWLIGIAHNVCLQRFRQTQRRPLEVEFVEETSPAAEDYEGPSAADLKRALSELPPKQRSALVMRELGGHSYAEIAATLSISNSALETLLFRARRALREQLEERLTCSEAAFAISKEADGRLSGAERRSLRAHLRACPDCMSEAQRDRATRRSLKSVLLAPLPQMLSTFSGASGGGLGLSSGIALKAAALLSAGALVGGGTYIGVAQPLDHHRTPSHAAVVPVLPPERAPAPSLTSLGLARLGGAGHKQHVRTTSHGKRLGHGAKAGKPAKHKLIRGGSERKTTRPHRHLKPSKHSRASKRVGRVAAPGHKVAKKDHRP